MWQMKDQRFFQFVLQTLWRRRKGLYYAVSVVSIAGNLIVLIGPSLPASTVRRNIEALQVAWTALPQVAELVLHRSVLYILLNLIVARIVVKSGMLGQTAAAAMPVMKQLDEFCVPLSSYSYSHVPRAGSHWPPSAASSIISTTCVIQSASTAPASMDSCKLLPRLIHGDANQISVTATEQAAHELGHARTPSPPLQTSSALKRCKEEKPKCALAPSLFTIEPLEEPVRSTDCSKPSYDNQARDQKARQHPLRKVSSRAMDLHRSTEKKCKAAAKAKQQLHQTKEDQSLQLVLTSQDADQAKEEDDHAAEHDDNRLSRKEFNERVDTFIVKFKRSLTMQRQDSLTRLLGLVGGGGDIRLLK